MHGRHLIAALWVCMSLAACARNGAPDRDPASPLEIRSQTSDAAASDLAQGGGVPEAAAFKPSNATAAPVTEPPSVTEPPIIEIDRATRDAIGAAALKNILARYPPANDPKLSEYLVLVGSLLTLDAPRDQAEYDYLLVDSDRPFSFAAVPKTLAVSRGLIARMNDEAELAGVLAGEMANLRADRALSSLGLKLNDDDDASHVRVETYAAKLADALLSQDLPPDAAELADLEGARIAAAAKYAPDGFLRVLARLHADAKPGTPQWQRLRTLDANVSIVAKAHPGADVRLPVRFESYVKPSR